MTAPNMATIAASLERSMQNCSLNHHHHRPTAVSGSQTIQGSTSHVGMRGKTSSSLSSTSSTTSDQTQQMNTNNLEEDRAVELNSNVSLPYHWEQCLDLKTGEIYYINWKTEMKAKEDPRTTAAQYMGDCYYSDDDEEDDEDDSSYDSEESSTESSPSSSRDREPYNSQLKESDESNNVLVVAGCKTCLMYHMVPKHHEGCPKCNAHLLHFDGSQTN